jgi:hypothetical protein
MALGLAGMILLAASVSAGPQTVTQFEGHTFRLQVPEDYSVKSDASPGPGVRTFGFATEPRSDGTRGMIQVTLIDLKKSGAPPVTLDALGTAMIEGVRRRRTQWITKESATEIAGVPGKRIEWSGEAELAPGRPPVGMRGVMLVGIKGDVAFALHTQDLSAFASGALPICEKALNSFTLTLR